MYYPQEAWRSNLLGKKCSTSERLSVCCSQLTRFNIRGVCATKPVAANKEPICCSLAYDVTLFAVVINSQLQHLKKGDLFAIKWCHVIYMQKSSQPFLICKMFLIFTTRPLCHLRGKAEKKKQKKNQYSNKSQ